MMQKMKTKRTQITIKENLANSLIENSKEHKMSLNTYVNFVLNSSTARAIPPFIVSSISRGYVDRKYNSQAAIASFCTSVIPPTAIFGLSLL